MRTYGSFAINEKHLFEALHQAGIDIEDASLLIEMRGGQCQVFQVRCGKEDKKFAVRVPAYMSPRGMVNVLETEMQNLRVLASKGFPWAPRCYGYSLTFDNPIKLPFLVLEWKDGSKLHWTSISPQRRERDRVLAQLARIQVRLTECTFESGCVTAQEFFERLLLNRRSRVEDGKLRGLSGHDCEMQKDLLPLALGSSSEDTGVAMDHGDLQPSNIIVDEDYNITGIIDWGFAAFVPLVRAAGLPRFLWLSPPSFTLDGATHEDRQTYISSLPLTHASATATYFQLWQTGENLDMRTLYIESLFSKGMHLALVKAGWQI